ncbi:MAG: ABC transporter permease [Anaerolineae bacterium]|jgi:putative ABC transport system permease protein
MLRPRWRKVLRDMWGNKGRTILVVLSIAVGVFAVGTVAQMRVIVSDDMVESYEGANPPSATVYPDRPFDDDLVEAVRRMPEVAEAEGRREVIVRFQHAQAETWYPLRLFAAADYDDMVIKIIQPEIEFGPNPAQWPNPDTFPPPDREVLIERTSLLLPSHGLDPNAALGDTLLIETPSGKRREMRMAGLVYDIATGSAPWTGMGYGYVTLDTLEWLGLPRSYSELHVLVAGDRRDVAHIERVVREVEDRVERSGLEVVRTDIPAPGKLPQDSIYQTLVMLLGALGILSLVVSVFLLVNTVSALLAQQVRQIGVMKAIGGRRHQVARMYLGMVAAFGLLAFVIAAPLGAWAARYVINFMAYFINFELGEFSIPLQVLVLEAGMALLVPLLAGLYPIFAGTQITVREAITSYGLSKEGAGGGAFDRLVERLRGLPRPLMLSLRNTFRRKGRLILTLTTLTLAGTVLIAVVSVRASLLLTLDELFEYVVGYDVEVQLGRAYRTDRLEQEALRVPGVVAVESWGSAGTYRLRPDGSEGDDIYLIAPPAETAMLNPSMVAGRWLLAEDDNSIVVSTNLLAEEPDLGVGSEIVLDIEDRETTWQIVGVARYAQPVSIAWVDFDQYSRVVRNVGRANMIDVATERHDAAFQLQVGEALQAHLEGAGLDVSSFYTRSQNRAAIDVLFNIIIIFLGSMALILTIVGGIGLTGTMSLSVLERIREIGVMRAIGASNGAVMQVVMAEGVVIGLMSWLMGTLLALPVGKVLSDAVGMRTPLNTPLSYTVPPLGVFLWLGLVVLLSMLASYVPAQSAAQLSVREVLAYEG